MKLETLADQLRLPRTELARRLGITDRTLRRWQHTSHLPRDAKRLVLLAVYQAKLEYVAMCDDLIASVGAPSALTDAMTAKAVRLSAEAVRMSAETDGVSAQAAEMSAKTDNSASHASAHASGDISPVTSQERPRRTPASPKSPPLPLSDAERVKLHAAFDKGVSAPIIEQIIEEALNHPAARKPGLKSEYLYVRGWLRREVPKLLLDKARLERAKTPYAAQVTEPTPLKLETHEERQARLEKQNGPIDTAGRIDTGFLTRAAS